MADLELIPFIVGLYGVYVFPFFLGWACIARFVGFEDERKALQRRVDIALRLTAVSVIGCWIEYFLPQYLRRHNMQLSLHVQSVTGWLVVCFQVVAFGYGVADRGRGRFELLFGYGVLFVMFLLSFALTALIATHHQAISF